MSITRQQQQQQPSIKRKRDESSLSMLRRLISKHLLSTEFQVIDDNDDRWCIKVKLDIEKGQFISHRQHIQPLMASNLVKDMHFHAFTLRQAEIIPEYLQCIVLTMCKTNTLNNDRACLCRREDSCSSSSSSSSTRHDDDDDNNSYSHEDFKEVGIPRVSDKILGAVNAIVHTFYQCDRQYQRCTPNIDLDRNESVLRVVFKNVLSITSATHAKIAFHRDVLAVGRAKRGLQDMLYCPDTGELHFSLENEILTPSHV